MQEKNTPELWDRIWDRSIPLAEDQYHLVKSENSIRWQRIEKRILDQFHDFRNLNVIEIGAGRGINAALFALRGAHVTVMDYSPSALNRCNELFQRIQLKTTRIQGNALAPPEELRGRFDVAMSFGLTEHFLGKDRIQINKSHFDLVKPGGLVIISVPHRNNPPYRIMKILAEVAGRWGVGEEYPYSRGELDAICKEIGQQDYEYFGDSFYESFQFINPLNKRTFRKWLRLGPPTYSTENIRKQSGSVFDTPLGYSLVLCARKQPQPVSVIAGAA